MVANDASKFKIRFDDENTETPVLEDVENLRIDKLSQRINLFAFLVPCVLAITIAFGYLDLRKRFDGIHSADTAGVQTLSKSLDSKFSSLSIRQARIEALLEKKISSIEETAARLEKNLKQTEKAVSTVQSSTPDKREISAIFSEVDRKLNPIQLEIKKISSETKLLQKTIDTEFAKLAASFVDIQKKTEALKNDTKKVKNDTEEVKKNVDILTSTKVDKKVFELATTHEEKFFQQKISNMEKSFSEKIENIQKQLMALEEKQKQISGAESAPISPATKVTAPPSAEGLKATVPEPGKIIEQELKR